MLLRTLTLLNIVESAPQGLTAGQIHTRLRDRFNVDKRTIYRDLQALDYIGLLRQASGGGAEAGSVRWISAGTLKSVKGALTEPLLNANNSRKVVLHFPRESSSVIQARLWHPSQTTREKDDGIELSIEASVDAHLTAWILGFGCTVKVIEPSELREELRKIALRLAELNS